MFFERHLENLIELFIPNTTEPKTVLDVLPLCKNYVKRLNISQLLPPIKEPQWKKDEKEYETDLVIGKEQDDLFARHFNFGLVLKKLTELEELHLVYRVKQCGLNFEWKMFQVTKRDCESLGKAVKSSVSLKVNIDSSLCYLF